MAPSLDFLETFYHKQETGPVYLFDLQREADMEEGQQERRA